MYKKAVSHIVEIPLFDRNKAPIVAADGAPTIEISKDSGVYAATTNTATHVDEELWTLQLTTTEATCDKYLLRVAHAEMSGVMILSDEAETQADGVAFSDILKLLLANMTGRAIPTDNGDGTATVVFYARDGETAIMTVTYSTDDGSRATTGVIA